MLPRRGLERGSRCRKKSFGRIQNSENRSSVTSFEGGIWEFERVGWCERSEKRRFGWKTLRELSHCKANGRPLCAHRKSSVPNLEQPQLVIRVRATRADVPKRFPSTA